MHLLKTQDWPNVFPLLDRRWIEVWYAVPPQELAPFLLQAPKRMLSRYPGAAMLRAMVSGNPLSELFDPQDVRGGTLDFRHELSRLSIVGTQQRLSGYPNAAMQLSINSRGILEQAEHPLIDSSDGFVPYLYLQSGITALLAGRPDAALAMLRRAQAADNDTRFGFVARDASFKLAILHAVYGEPSHALGALSLAEELPAGETWAERWITQTGVIARILIAADVGFNAPPTSPSLSTFGEMWPFAMFAQVRQAIFDREFDLAEEIIRGTDHIILSGTVGDGVSAAAIPLSEANLALARGRIQEAREAVAKAPEHLAPARVTLARINYLSGEHDRVFAGAAQKSNPALAEFSRHRIEYASLIAASYLALNEDRVARELMRNALRGRRVIPATLRSTLPIELLDYASDHWQEDPGLVALTAPPGSSAPKPQPLYPAASRAINLSRREHQILERLILGRRRTEIAEDLFLSDNTVHSHIKSLYRKLGVSSRQEAIIAGLALHHFSSPDLTP